MLNLGFKSRVVKMGLLVLGLGIAGAVVAQTHEQQVAQRLQPVGQVCLAGEPCATGGAPAASGATAAAFDPATTYDQYCAMCHNTGMAGAPRRGDADHWTARVEEAGFATIVTNAVNGVNAMPPRGMCTTCSDEDIATLVEYLSGESAE
ncbi:MAG TPA: cytochrome c5 family protein [Pseudohongiella sp.]|nr:cytochrome c5 family protein [Pseudohongiella sp.]MAY55057.1 cytochrome c5 family protein [Gammaproteobacteria bacterium]MBJ55391.1 cytochrome c5 family protein [Gammaproteobacteria bacterium]HBX37591.1 cytochrome c5 family protein [Pseudohongiella sp.]|tara:strand:+ start:2431 stop:2877 length:447 start_codon:yes stop_codon:yes gene_type:complete